MKIQFTLFLLLLVNVAWSQAPRLVIPIGHSDVIIAGAISPDENYMLTGSVDHTAILWDKTGKELQTFKGHSAQVLAVGFLYTGTEKLVLTGDADGHIKLWKLDGTEKKTISEDPGYRHGSNWVDQMTFSPDGKTVCLKARQYEKCLDILTRADANPFGPPPVITPPAGVPESPFNVFSEHYLLIGEGTRASLWGLSGKKLQTFTGHSTSVVSVAYAPTDRILIGNGNGTACLWDLENNRDYPNFAKNTGIGEGFCFSADGKNVVYSTGDAVKLLDEEGKLSQQFAGTGPFAMAPNSKTILTNVDGNATLWDRISGKKLRVFNTKGPDNPWSQLSDVAFSPATADNSAGSQYIATSSSQVSIWNPEAPATPVRTIAQVDDDLGLSLNTNSSVEFSADGKALLTIGGDENASVIQTDIQTGTETNRYIGHHEKINAVVSAKGPNGGMFILAGSNDNTAKLWDPANNVVKSQSQMARQMGDPIGFDLVGGEIQTYSGHLNDVTAVAFSSAGTDGPKYVLTGSLDRTVKVWDRATGTEIATLICLDTTDWVVTSPSGLFDASPGAMKKLYYVFGTEVIDLEQLKERYYEPGLLYKITGFSKGSLRDVSVLGDLPLYPVISATIEQDQLNIQLQARSGGMGKLSLFINGKEVAENLNPDAKTKLRVDLNAYDKYYLPGDNLLALRVYNSANWLKSPACELEYTPPAQGRGSGNNNSSGTVLGNAKPELYVIVIGTSDYSGTQLDLRFPDLDAAAMAQALSSTGKALFAERVHLRLLTTDAKSPADISSKKNIAAAFSAYAAQAKPTDILVCYFSGHGLTYGSAEKSQFYYLTKDIASADLKDDAVRNNYTVSSDDLTNWLTAIAAKKQVMILDACNSGKAVEALSAIGARELNSSQIRALDRMKDRTGMFILTGAAADKVSYEASQYGQGLLTYSLLQGMSGLALTSDKRVDVMTLFQYARDEVPVLAKSIKQVQIPVLAFPAGGGSFDIGIVDASVKIPLAQVKPVFIRNNFQEEVSYDDIIGLTEALADYFREITARGAQAELIYVDVKEYENAYSIKGRYSLDGDQVQVNGRLYQGKKPIGQEFKVAGKKSELSKLVNAIVDEVSKLL